MKKLYLPFILSILLFNCQSQNQWQSLFNGKDLSAWTVKTHPKDENYTYWKVNDGVIEANSLERPEHDYVWLYSKKEYDNFILKLKFRPFQGISGNSGVQIRSRYDEEINWLNGPQIDIHPSGAWRTGMMWDETKGNQRWIFPDIPDGEWVDPAMAINDAPFYYAGDTKEWNDFRIVANGMQIECYLNDIKVTDFNGEGILNDPVHKQKSVGENGHIALQIHKGDSLKIQFKDIQIKEL